MSFPAFFVINHIPIPKGEKLFDIQGSPAAEFFKDSALLVAGENTRDSVTREWSCNHTTLFIDPRLTLESLNVNIYDAGNRKDVVSANLTDYESAETLFLQINKDYPNKIELPKMLDMSRVFFEVLPNVCYVGEPVRGGLHNCEYCGINDDEFQFLLVPASPGTALNEASLNLHWEYGCYGGTGVNGIFSDTKDDALDLLQQILSAADKEYRPAVKEAIGYLKTFKG